MIPASFCSTYLKWLLRRVGLNFLNPDKMKETLKIELGEIILEGDLTLPPLPKGLVLFAHGSGSGRFSPRNQFVASHLNTRGYATFLLDLYSLQESELQEFNLQELANRFQHVILKLKSFPFLTKLPVGLYGSSTGAAVALVAAAHLREHIQAVVSRGGRTDLANAFLQLVQAPSLLLAGENDHLILEINRKSLNLIDAPKALKIIPNASHLFDEPGAIEAVADEAGDWFEIHLSKITSKSKGRINQ